VVPRRSFEQPQGLSLSVFEAYDLSELAKQFAPSRIGIRSLKMKDLTEEGVVTGHICVTGAGSVLASRFQTGGSCKAGGENVHTRIVDQYGLPPSSHALGPSTKKCVLAFQRRSEAASEIRGVLVRPWWGPPEPSVVSPDANILLQIIRSSLYRQLLRLEPNTSTI
jgi:hypothetical protein